MVWSRRGKAVVSPSRLTDGRAARAGENPLHVAEHISTRAGCEALPKLDVTSHLGMWSESGIDGRDVSPILNQFCNSIGDTEELVTIAA